MHVLHIMKVVLIAGAENHLLMLLPGLQRLGVAGSVLLLVEPGKPMDDFAARAAAADIPLTREVIHRHLDTTLPGRLRRHLRDVQPDIVHTHLLHADLYGVPVARSLGIPVVMSRHNDNAFRRRPLMRLLNGGLWAMADAGIVISDAIGRFVREVEYAPVSKVHRVHYGMEPSPSPPDGSRDAVREALGLPAHALIFGTVSRLIEQKGLPDAVAAFAQIAADFPQAHLAITGDGPLRAELQAQAAATAAAERVHFLGWQPDVARIYPALDVFLMPSLWEGFGLVMLEAMGHHLPVIGTRVSAIPEVVVDGETGRIVPPANAAALADAMRALAADADLRRQMGSAGRARLAAHFSVRRMAEATAQVYRGLVTLP